MVSKLLQQFPSRSVTAGILLAIARCWPQTRVQRCIYHVWQNIRVKLTMHPQTEAWQELWQIKTPELSQSWQQKLTVWHENYGDFIRERTDKASEPGKRR